MAKIFDRLIEISKHNSVEGLERMLRSCALFEVPFNVQKMVGLLEEQRQIDQQSFKEYVKTYFNESKKQGMHFAMPYPITAIEDPEGVVIYQNLHDNVYDVINFSSYTLLEDRNHQDPLFGKTAFTIETGEIKHEFRDGNLHTELMPKYEGITILEESFPLLLRPSVYMDESDESRLYSEIARGFTSALEETIYIMDPENFIIRVESNLAKQHEEKLARKSRSKQAKLRKTPLKRALF